MPNQEDITFSQTSIVQEWLEGLLDEENEDKPKEEEQLPLQF